MSFQSQGERAPRATSRLLGDANAVVIQNCVRLALLTGFAALAWLLAGYMNESIAHAEPIAENAPTRPADGDASAVRPHPLMQWVSKPGHTVQEAVFALGNSSWKASAPASALQPTHKWLEDTDTGSTGDEVVVASQEPLTSPELERAPQGLDAITTPLVERIRPLAQVAQTLLAPVEPVALDVVEQAIPGNPLTSPVKPVGHQQVVTSSPTSDTTPLEWPRFSSDAAASTFAAATDSDTPTVLPENDTHLPQSLPPVPGGNQSGMGNVSGNSGSGLGPHIGGTGVTTTEYAAPTMSDLRLMGASEVTHVNPDVLEDPTFSPD
ncbi:MAG: hypothetical protein HOQ05_05870 [Corynebacteriales bacterium]|nr:hypothetical protein [Mycobacteriales bacterium]